MVCVVVVLGILFGFAGKPVGTLANENAVHFDAIYFPWVPHGDEIDGTGPWHGSITIQNIQVDLDSGAAPEQESVRFWVFDDQTMNQIALNDDGSGESYGFEDALEDSSVPRYDLDPDASITLSAANLGIAEPGSAVAIFAVYKEALEIAESDPTDAHLMGAPTIAGVHKQATPDPMINARTGASHNAIDGYTAIPFADVAWGEHSEFCLAGGDVERYCDGTGLYDLAADAHGDFDGHSYLPVVQRNDGWNTELYLSNVSIAEVTAAQVNVTLIASDQQGQSATEEYKITETFNIPAGGTRVMDIADWVEDGWVGSAHITSTVGVATTAMRSKPSETLLMGNTSAPSLEQTIADSGASSHPDQYQQYAPLVYKDFNGWSTGFSFVNIAEEYSRVTVTYYDSSGAVVAGDSRTISPQGQEFIYTPAQEETASGAGFVGSALFTSDQPFHVAVDQVKYSTGEAMSYLATAAGATVEGPDSPGQGVNGALLMPLVQKGMLDGTGDSSGLQLFNPSPSEPVTIEVTFYDSAGALLPPTKLSPIELTLSPKDIATLHTPSLSEMAQNQRGSVVVVPIAGDGQVVGVSNNVNYTARGDGSTAFNMVNINGQYRFPTPGFASR